MSDNNGILVKPPQLRKSAAQLFQSAKTIQSCVNAVDQQIQALGPTVFEGRSADEIRTRYQRLREKVFSFKPLVDSFGKNLEGAAARFKQRIKALRARHTRKR